MNFLIFFNFFKNFKFKIQKEKKHFQSKKQDGRGVLRLHTDHSESAELPSENVREFYLIILCEPITSAQQSY